MSVPRLFYCTVAGLVVATLVSFLFGASGLLNYHRLQTHERRVAAGIAALEERHFDLGRRLNMLRTEPELLRLLAREIGYYRSDELVIRVGPQSPADGTAGGASPYAPDFSDVGPLVQRKLPLPRDPFNVLALGLFLGVGLFAALTVRSALRRRSWQADGTDGVADYADGVAGSVEEAATAGGWPAPDLGRVETGASAADDDAAVDPPDPAGPNGTPRPAAAADPGSERAAGPRQGGGDGADDVAGEPAPRRKRRRARRRRGAVTVYRL